MNQPSFSSSSLPPGIHVDGSNFKVDFVKSLDGKRVHLYASHLASLEEAMRVKEELLTQKSRALQQKSLEQCDFRSFFSRYVDYRSLHVRHSSISQAESVYHKYFQAQEKEQASLLLSPLRLGEIYRQVIHDPALCNGWKNRIIGVLRSFVDVARKWKILDVSSSQEAKDLLENIPEDKPRTEKLIWSKREEERFLSVIEDPTHKMLFTLFVELGARLSEFLGLAWDVFDARRGTLVIKRQLLHASQRTFVLSDTLKTKESYRVCKLTVSTKEALIAYRKNHPKHRYLFVSPQDETLPLSKASFRYLFHRYIEKAGVRRITPHAIRHAKATKLVKVARNMLEVKAAARYLGHSASMLMDVYSHCEEKTIETLLRRL